MPSESERLLAAEGMIERERKRADQTEARELTVRKRVGQAEAQLKELRRERDEADQRAEKWHTAWVNNANHMEARVEQAEVQLEQVRGDLKGTEAQWTATERKLEDCEAQRDALAGPLARLVELRDRGWFPGDSSKEQRAIWERARIALDALDQTNREVRS